VFINHNIDGGRPARQGRWSHRAGVIGPSAAWAFLAVMVLGAAARAGAPAAQNGPARVEFQASDGVRIAADFSRPKKGGPVFLLLHGLGAGRGEWGRLSGLLRERGWGALAIDARGHGESGGPRYTEFRTPAAWAAIEKDLAGALRFLSKKGFPRRRVVLVGASIGANLVLEFAAREKAIPFVVLLSPGVDYQGLRIEGAARAFDRPMILAASLQDAYALRSAELVLEAARHKGTRLLRAQTGHGATMLDGEPNADFEKELLRAMAEAVGTISGASSGTPPSP